MGRFDELTTMAGERSRQTLAYIQQCEAVAEKLRQTVIREFGAPTGNVGFGILDDRLRHVGDTEMQFTTDFKGGLDDYKYFSLRIDLVRLFTGTRTRHKIGIKRTTEGAFTLLYGRQSFDLSTEAGYKAFAEHLYKIMKADFSPEGRPVTRIGFGGSDDTMEELATPSTK